MNDPSWLVADRLWSGLSWTPGPWVDVVRGLVPAAKDVHDELMAKLSVEAGQGLPLRALDRRAPALRHPGRRWAPSRCW